MDYDTVYVYLMERNGSSGRENFLLSAKCIDRF